MVYFMGRRFDNGNGPPLPPRIKAAFDYLDHVRQVTTQMDASVPARDLSPLEKNVELAALRALQQYLLGEMDFVETPAAPRPSKRDDDEGTASAPSGCTT
jgi:hypothetical protein